MKKTQRQRLAYQHWKVLYLLVCQWGMMVVVQTPLCPFLHPPEGNRIRIIVDLFYVYCLTWFLPSHFDGSAGTQKHGVLPALNHSLSIALMAGWLRSRPSPLPWSATRRKELRPVVTLEQLRFCSHFIMLVGQQDILYTLSVGHPLTFNQGFYPKNH